MRGVSAGVIHLLDRVLGAGVKPGMGLKEENAINKASLVYLLVGLLALVAIEEVFRLRAYEFFPIALAILGGALLCFGIVARTGRPFLPNLLLLGGLSAYFLVRTSTGGDFGIGYISTFVLPFLYFFACSFRTALALLLALLAGLALLFFIPGDPLLVADYSQILRQRIFLASIFSGSAAILGEYTRWRMQQRVSLLMQELAESAKTDQLTGLYNRRAFLERLTYETVRSIREKLPVSIVLLDIDHFKNVNDDYGHGCGDMALRYMADLMRSTIRQQDTAARWGGEEFILLLPETSLEGAAILAEKLRAVVEDSSFACGGISFGLTISLGVHQYDHGESLDANIGRADARLYQAKHECRNRVIC